MVPQNIVMKNFILTLNIINRQQFVCLLTSDFEGSYIFTHELKEDDELSPSNMPLFKKFRSCL